MVTLENFQIKEMERFEIEEVLEIQRSNNLTHWSSANYLDFIENKQFTKLVAKFEQRTIGFAIMRLINFSEEAPLNGFTEGEIYNIGVHNSYKKKGIGTLLIKTLIQNYTEQALKAVWLEVRESNELAINFYKNNGFKEIYIRKNYYNNPKENAFVMKLDLSKTLKTTKLNL